MVDQPTPQPASSTVPPASSAAARSGSVSTHAAHLVGETGAVQRAESAAQFGAVLVERDAAALAEVGDELWEREGDAREQAGRRRDVCRVRLVDEHGRV